MKNGADNHCARSLTSSSERLLLERFNVLSFVNKGNAGAKPRISCAVQSQPQNLGVTACDRQDHSESIRDHTGTWALKQEILPFSHQHACVYTYRDPGSNVTTERAF